MADTIETLLVGIGIDPKSLDILKADLQKAKDSITGKPVELKVNVDSGAVVGLGAAFGKIQASAEQAKVALAAFGATVFGIQSFFRSASSEAAESEVNTRKLTVAFGEASGKALEFAGALADKFNRDDDIAKQALADMGLFIQGFGVGQKEALKFAEQITEVGFQIGTALGKSPTEVVNNLQAALMRGGRAARALGIDLGQAAINAKALALGFDPATMSQTEQIQTKLSLIVEQSTKRYGDLNKESKLFTTSLTELSDQVGEVVEAIGAYVNEALQPLIEILTPIVKEVRAFIESHKVLTKTILGAVGGIAAIAVALGGFSAAILSITGAVALFNISWTAAGALMTSSITLVTTLSSALLVLADRLLLVTVNLAGVIGAGVIAGFKSLILYLGPAGAVGAAGILGFELGKIIDKLFGVSQGIADLGRETERWRLLREEAERLGLQIGKNAFSQKLFNAEIAKGGSPTSVKNTLLEFEIMAEKIRQAGGDVTLFNELVTRGASKQSAFGQALGGNNVALTLFTQKAKLSTDQQRQLDIILQAVGMSAEEYKKKVLETANGVERGTTATKAEIEAMKQRKAAMEELAKFLDKASDAQITSSNKIVAEFSKTVDIFSKHAASLKRGSEEFKADILSINTAVKNSMEEITKNIAGKVNEQKAIYSRQIAEVRATKDALLAIYDQQLAGLQNTLGGLKPVADKSNDVLKGFSEDQEANRRRDIDSRLNEVDSIKKTLTENLKYATNMGVRNQAVKDAVERLNALKKATEDDIALQKDVVAANKAVTDARKSSQFNKADMEEFNRLTKERDTLQARLNERLKAQSTVEQEVAESINTIQSINQNTAEDAAKNAKTIIDTETEILNLQNQRAAAVLAGAQAEIVYGQALKANLELLKQLETGQKERVLLKAGRETTALEGVKPGGLSIEQFDSRIAAHELKMKPLEERLARIQQAQTLTATQGAVVEAEQTIATNAQQAKLSVTTSEATKSKAFQEASDVAKLAVDANKLSEETMSAFLPDLEAAKLSLDNIGKALPDVNTKIDDMVGAEWSVSSAIGDLTATLKTQFTGLADVTNKNAEDIKTLSDAIKRIKIPTKGSGGVDASTEGIGGGEE